MAIEREKLRMWVYDALTRPPHQVGASGQNLQLSDVAVWVKQRAQQDQAMPQDSRFAQANLEKADEDAIRECIWGLIIQGIVVPGISNDGSYGVNLPWLQVSEWGRACLQTGEYVPHDTGLYLSRARAQIPDLDPVAILYLQEALNSFRAGNFIAAAIMMGVASEQILILLRDAIRNAIPEDNRKKKLMAATENQAARRIYEEVIKRVDPIHDQLPQSLQQSIGTELEGIFHLVRRTRNDAGHPTGRLIDRDEAYALLQLFPVYAKSAYGLMDWLRVHPI